MFFCFYLHVSILDTVCCEWKDVSCVWRNCIKRGFIANYLHLDLDSFFVHAKPIFKTQVEMQFGHNELLKIFAILSFKMVKIIDGENKYKTMFLYKNAETLSRVTELDEFFETDIKEHMFAQFSKYQENGSGWALSSIKYMDLYMLEFSPLRG